MWKSLSSAAEFDALLQSSFAFLIFKHSSRCGISAMVKRRFQSSWEENPDNPVYLIDVIRDRELSQHIARTTGVQHESPQVIAVRDGHVAYEASHSGVSASQAKASLEN